MPAGLDGVKADFQTGVAQATRISGSRVEACGEVPSHTAPTPPRALQGPWMTQGSSEGKGEPLPYPANPALRAVRTGPDLMTVTKPLRAWGILQDWTFGGSVL